MAYKNISTLILVNIDFKSKNLILILILQFTNRIIELKSQIIINNKYIYNDLTNSESQLYAWLKQQKYDDFINILEKNRIFIVSKELYIDKTL